MTVTVVATVELDVFSGRENPLWSLSSAEVTALLEKILALPQGDPQDFPDHLGYRGMKVKLPSNDHSLASMRVYLGLLETTGLDGHLRYYKDHESEVEKFLFYSGKPWLDSELYDTLLHEIER